MQSTTKNVSQYLSINPNSQKQITINHIFSHNYNFDVYRHKHKDEIRTVEMEEVEKMLMCEDLEYRLYFCPGCDQLKDVHFSCNSRACTYCGKRFTDRWTNEIARKTFNMTNRHVMLTIPEELRSVFYEDRTLLKALMDYAICSVSDIIEWRLNYKDIPGIVVVLHTYGKDMKLNPHLYCLVTESGFKNNGMWVDVNSRGDVGGYP